MTSTAPFLRGAYLVPERLPEGAGYPFSVPALAGLSLALSSPVTFLVGENGSGKSTLIEALAVLCGLSPSGGGKNEVGERFGTQDRAPLASALRPQFIRRPSDAFFFRAETLAHFATLLEERNAIRFFGVIPTNATAGAPSTSARTARPSSRRFSTDSGRGCGSSTSPKRRSHRSGSSRSSRSCMIG